ncbi:hypothetical protein [Roseomonas gilardii]|uniref:hypothetical protein n=1 Tax=Roseomonas gilardii TaxID=257708 RepID=UPI001C92C4CB|nr:hypothetical protein [Roseomonas gilardii]
MNMQAQGESRLPEHGRVACTACFDDKPLVFDVSQTGCANWRITANPCAWGGSNAEVVVLGFSKGPTQAGALARKPHDQIAYKGARRNVERILQGIGLLSSSTKLDELIADRQGRFAFGSLVRCSVERRHSRSGTWKGTGGDMLSSFLADSWGRQIVRNCTTRFLGSLPEATKLVVLFGFGKNGSYVNEAERVIQAVRGGDWRRLNEVAYTDGRVIFVHVEHFRSLVRLITDWLGEDRWDGSPPCPKRTRWRQQAAAAVQVAYPRGFQAG